MTTTSNSREEPLEAVEDFRRYLPDLSTPRFQVARTQTPYEYVDAFRKSHVPPWLFGLTETWKELLEEPFEGVTSNGTVHQKTLPTTFPKREQPNPDVKLLIGTVKRDLFKQRDDSLNTAQISQAVNGLFDKLNQEQKAKVQFPINAREWRAWSNPEFLLRPFGLRLEELSEDVLHGIYEVMSTSLSLDGYAKAMKAMEINHFLGEICEIPAIMNRHSYNFLLFGKPSSTDAWGWSLYGHHLCLNLFFKENQIEISPTFTGAEPNIIDRGPLKGTRILHEEGDLGLKFMQSLSQDQKDKAQIYALLKDPKMLQSGNLKVDRWNQDDQRHLCGAFRDNRVVPYEGVVVSSLTAEQQDMVLDIAEQFLLYYPPRAREARKVQIAEHFDETYFSWVGEYSDGSAFYYRIQSPVILLEFDHHSGVFLSNSEPAKFHTHTIVRTPNGGDYGNAIRSTAERLA